MATLQTSNQNTTFGRSVRRRSPIGFVVLLVLVVILGVVAYNRQGVYDTLSLRNYRAPASVVSIAADDTFTSNARRVFYVNHPAIDAKTAFAKVCPSGNEQTVVLGCYHGNQSGIYVLAVTDDRLHGIEQVTAAHELLHAAYDRLNSSQKQHIDSLLTDFYNNDLKDATVKAQIDSYKQTEPAEIVNEMHSILGTEITKLTPQLEQYYSQYFTNRATIANYYNQYQAEFTSRQNQIKAYDTQLTSLKAQISAAEADIKSQEAIINAEQTDIETLKRENDIADYNASIPGYNTKVDSYNAEIASTQAQITQYNQMVASRNTLAAETQQLTNEISSSITPASK